MSPATSIIAKIKTPIPTPAGPTGLPTISSNQIYTEAINNTAMMINIMSFMVFIVSYQFFV